MAIDARKRAPEIPLDEAAAAVFGLRDAGAGPEQIAASRQMTALLEHLIDGLPRELRHTLALSTVDELSSPEIAEVLGIPEGSVRERLWRARQLLKEKLAASLVKDDAVKIVNLTLLELAAAPDRRQGR